MVFRKLETTLACIHINVPFLPLPPSSVWSLAVQNKLHASCPPPCGDVVIWPLRQGATYLSLSDGSLKKTLFQI